MHKISIVIPAHNEENRIEKTLLDYTTFFNKTMRNKYEIIIVTNGCLDNTLEIVKKLARKNKYIKYFDIKESVGKGGAIVKGFEIAKGYIIGFTDADDSTKAEEFYRLASFINGADGVIGSRWVKGAVIAKKQPLKRRIASRGFNIINKILFGIPFRDTQCGAKVFKREAIKKLNGRIKLTGWSFDINLLYLLNKLGYIIKEVPTVWEDSEGSSLKIRSTIPKMFLSVIRLRLIYSPFGRIGPFFRPITGRIYKALQK